MKKTHYSIGEGAYEIRDSNTRSGDYCCDYYD